MTSPASDSTSSADKKGKLPQSSLSNGKRTSKSRPCVSKASSETEKVMCLDFSGPDKPTMQQKEQSHHRYQSNKTPTRRTTSHVPKTTVKTKNTKSKKELNHNLHPLAPSVEPKPYVDNATTEERERATHLCLNRVTK